MISGFCLKEIGQQFAGHWTPGEVGATQNLENFINFGLAGYKEGRNFPPSPHVTSFSSSALGEISPNQAWYAA